MSIVGHIVELKTKLGQVHGGRVWAHDKGAGLMTLQSDASSGDPNLCNITMLRTSHIAEVLKSEPPPEAGWRPPLRPIEPAKVEARMHRASEAMERQIASTNKDASAEAQALFDALSRTLACKWAGIDIHVEDIVKIAHPYTPEAAALLPSVPENAQHIAQNTLRRVQKIMRDHQRGSTGGGASGVADTDAVPAGAGAAVAAAGADSAEAAPEPPAQEAPQGEAGAGAAPAGESAAPPNGKADEAAA